MKSYRKLKYYDCEPLNSHYIHIIPGPDNWHSCYPDAAGKRQSPIDITSVNLTTLNTNHKLRWKYVPDNIQEISNPGYCWKVNVKGDGSGMVIRYFSQVLPLV